MPKNRVKKQWVKCNKCGLKTRVAVEEIPNQDENQFTCTTFCGGG